MWEDVTMNEAASSFVRSYTGAFCAMAHGMFRWSYLQRSMSLTLTADAITARAPMKNHKFLTPWAAPRRGFSGRDWAGPWMTALQQAGLPGQDFVLRACNARCNGFTTAIGEYRHAQSTMLSLLCLQPFGLTKQMASTYGLHGFRHVYTTAMRQLDLPLADIDDAGRWRLGPEMIRTYDS